MKKLLSAVDLDAQENLTPARLALLTRVERPAAVSFRPTSSFIDLMEWVTESFRSSLPSDDEVIRFVHNRIIIDGQFVHYCDTNKIKIECLYNDSVISWDGGDTEKFFVQGVFRVSGDGFQFIHCALFHKGNQNEDEVSFFNLVPQKSYESYLKLRNAFDEWCQERDRTNLHIRVVEGDDIPYDRDSSWEDLFLPVSLKNEIMTSVETFLNSEEFYTNAGIPWKRGILLWGEPGNGKTSIIRTIASSYNFKPVTIAPGAGDSAIREAFSYAESQSPALLYFEDLDSLYPNINQSMFLNLLDGVSSKNGLLVVATANTLDVFASNITDRPSRFDRKFEVPSPDKTMTSKYLKRWFGKYLNAKSLQKLVTTACSYRLSYAYLKELYISSMYNALAANRKTPTFADAKKALDQLVAEKELVKGRRIQGLDRYLAKDG